MSEDRKYYELFDDKSISDVFKDIYKNAANTRSNAKGMIDQMKPFVKNIESAVVIGPLIREYMEIVIRSDEHLIKLADSAIRLIKEGKIASTEGPGFLSEKEKKQLLEDVEDYEKYKKVEDKNKKTLDERVEAIKEELLTDEVEEPVAEEPIEEEK
jgi:esterase/lipase